jgi:acetyltransferase-like isoleucine patch superfamily enzyme
MSSPFRPFAARVYSRLMGSGVSVRGDGNRIDLADSVRRKCTVRINGHRNHIELGPQCRLWDLTIEVVGDDHHLIVGGGCSIRGGHWLLEDRGSRLTIGPETTMISGRLIASEGHAITLGEDCMLGADIEIRCSDGHSILEKASGVRINPPADITLSSHVWIGAAVRVLKGVTIGRETIVAAGAVVTRSLPANCVAAGIPAKVVREGVTWDRERLPLPPAPSAVERPR